MRRFQNDPNPIFDAIVQRFTRFSIRSPADIPYGGKSGKVVLPKSATAFYVPWCTVKGVPMLEQLYQALLRDGRRLNLLLALLGFHHMPGYRA
jgi:hypothetical protein